MPKTRRPLKNKRTRKTGSGCGCGLTLPFFNGGKGVASKRGMCMKCGKRHHMKHMKGGNQPYLVGAPWTSNIQSWPGVQGLQGETNYFPLNKYEVDPQTQGIISERNGSFFDSPAFQHGGTRNHHIIRSFRGRKNKSNRKRTTKKRGGSMISNILGDIKFGLGSAYNATLGYPAPVNPLPYMDQYSK